MKLRFILRCGLFSFLCLWCVGILYFVCWDQKDFWPAVSLNYTDKTRNNINTTDQHVPNYMFWSNEHVNKEEEKVDEGVNHHLLACHLPTRQAMPLILSLQHPQRPFHGNHWFHFGEYYLSQRRYLQAHLVTHISSVQFNHIYIVTIDKKIFQMATSFTFFLLLLTLPSEYQQLPVSFVYTTDDLHLLDHHQPWSADSTMERFCPFQKVQVQKESFHFQNGIITASTSNKFKAIEGYYIGSIGSVPISSTEWFRNQDEVASLRTSLQSVCAVDTSTSTTVQGIAAQGVAGSKAKVVIYQRNEQRKLLNLIETFLQSNQSQYSILRDKMDVEVIVHDENRDPCSLCNALQHADVLITSHGFQLTGKLKLSSH